MTPRAVLWLAVVLAEVGALSVAIFRETKSAGWPSFKGVPIPFVKKLARIFQELFRSPIVALLAAAVAIDLAVGLHDPPSSWGLSALAAAGPRPRVGLARAAYHLADALVMAWPGLLAATCGRVFLGNSRGAETSRKSANPGRDLLDSAAFRWRRTGRRVLAGCYLGAVVGLAAAYPLGQVRTQQVLLAWEAVALLFAAGAIFAGWRRVTAGGGPWTRAHGVLLVLVPVELAVAAIGPFAREDVFSAWDVARWQYLVAFVVVACVLAAPRRRR